MEHGTCPGSCLASALQRSVLDRLLETSQSNVLSIPGVKCGKMRKSYPRILSNGLASTHLVMSL